MQLIAHHELFALGIGYVDAHLLAATMRTADTTLWTRDRCLPVAAQRFGTSYAPAPG